MRSIVILFISVLVSMQASGQSAEKSVLIRGQLTNGAGLKSIFLDRLAGNPVPIDTFYLNEELSFQFEFQTTTADIYRIRISDPNFLMIILEPGDTLDITANALQLNQGTTLDGSLETMKVYSIGPYVSQFELVLDSISKKYEDFKNRQLPAEDLQQLQEQFLEVRDTFWTFLRRNIENDPGAMAWLFFIEKLEIEQDFPHYSMVAQALRTRYPDNFYVKNLINKVEAERKLAIGSFAPDITLPTPQGGTASLSDLRGKVVLIDFWAGWCGPCRKENPNLRRLHKRFSSHGFDIFGVSLDKTRESWVDAIAKDSLSWTQVSDLLFWQSAAAKEYQVSSIPHTVLIDAEGRILARKLRGEALEKKLEELFPQAE